MRLGSFGHESGDGTGGYVVYDYWCPIGILQPFITHRDLYNARLDANIMVKDIVVNEICNWSVEWISKYPMLSHVAPRAQFDHN